MIGFEKIFRHIKSGTLIKAIMRKLSQISLKGKPPIGDEYYGDKARNYLDHRDSDTFWNREHEVLSNEFQTLEECKNRKVLDIPFGTGRFVDLYLSHDIKVYGLDSSKDMLNVSKELLKERYEYCSLNVGLSNELPYEDDFFDLLVCFRFIPWVVSYRQVLLSLEEFHRVLALKGVALLEFSLNMSNSFINEKNIDKESIIWDQLNQEQIIKMLKENGFLVKKIIFISDDEENPNMHLFTCVKNEDELN